MHDAAPEGTRDVGCYAGMRQGARTCEWEVPEASDLTDLSWLAAQLGQRRFG